MATQPVSTQERTALTSLHRQQVILGHDPFLKLLAITPVTRRRLGIGWLINDPGVVSARLRPNSTLAAAYDLKVFFTVMGVADAFGVLPMYDRDEAYPNLNDDDYHALTAVFALWQQEIRQR